MVKKIQFFTWAIYWFIISYIEYSDCDCCCQVIDKGVNTSEIATIIKIHNDLRNLLVKGKILGQPKAAFMKKMKWDRTLAREAQKLAESCVYGHNIISDKRFYVGQNIYLFKSTANRKGSNWEKTINDWFNEYKFYKYPKFTPSVGHYTQIVSAETNYIGCGYSYYKNSNEKLKYQKYYVCNYGPGGNIIGKPPYKKVTQR